MIEQLRAPFPWFGGKRLVAPVVWERFGDVPNYVEPFFGSGAVMLARPHVPRVETVNDKDALLSNFWRAVQADPEEVAYWADWPISEADLHARHLFLVNRREWVESLITDPDFYDAQIAGWWVWGLCQWIGGGWCAEPKVERPDRKHPDLRQHVGLTGDGAPGRGIHGQVPRKRPRTWRGQPGALSEGVIDRVQRRRVRTSRGQGVLLSPRRQLPDLQADAGAAGRGIHVSGPVRQRPTLIQRGGSGVTGGPASDRRAWLIDTFARLQDRLRNVRIVCGEWDRVLGPTPTWKTGLTGVFLDPPYSQDQRDAGIYVEDAVGLADRVRAWAIANGDNPLMRIALCGYDTEHVGDMPSSWTAWRWKAHGGFGSQAKKTQRAQENSRREVIWFSPHCLPQGLFDEHVMRLEVAG